MLRLKELERQQAADSTKIAEALKDIAAQTKDIHEQSQSTSTRTDNFIRFWTKAAVVIVGVALAIIVMTYLFPEFGKHIGQAIDKFLGYPLG